MNLCAGIVGEKLQGQPLEIFRAPDEPVGKAMHPRTGCVQAHRRREKAALVGLVYRQVLHAEETGRDRRCSVNT